MATVWIASRRAGVRYNGSNSAEVIAFCNAQTPLSGRVWSIASETGGVLTLNSVDYGIPHPGAGVLNTGEWVLQGETEITDFGITDVVMAGRFRTQAEIAAALAAEPNLAAVLNPVAFYKAVGQGNLNALTLLNPNQTVNGTWDRTIPGVTVADVSWRAHAGTAILSQIQLQDIASPIVVTSTTWTIHLRTVGIASVAGIVQLDAARLVKA